MATPGVTRVFFVGLFCVFIPLSTADNEAFRRVFGLTKPRCVNLCDGHQRCLGARFTRNFQMCEMFDNITALSPTSPGTWHYRKQHHQIPELCTTCGLSEECHVYKHTPVCVVDGCRRPPPIPLAQTYGNIHSIGSKVKYQCLDDSTSSIASCLDDGTWSQTSLSCTRSHNCVAPDIPDGESHVYHRNDGLYGADITCPTDFVLQQTQPPTCDPVTGHWTNVDDVWCNQVVDGNWRKIHSFPSRTSLHIIRSWGKDVLFPTRYAYRNGSFIDNWKSIHISQVKLNVIKDKNVAAFIVLNGHNSTSTSWFSAERILESSWTDLTMETVTLMSWNGIRELNGTLYNIRRVVAKTLNTGACHDSGWLVATWHYYPCNRAHKVKGLTKILFATGTSATTFSGQDAGYADRYEVWVK